MTAEKLAAITPREFGEYYKNMVYRGNSTALFGKGIGAAFMGLLAKKDPSTGYKLSYAGLSAFSRDWVIARYCGISEAIHSVISREADEHFFETARCAYLEALRANFGREFLSKLTPAFWTFLTHSSFETEEEDRKRFLNFVKDTDSPLYNKGLYDGGDLVFSFKMIFFFFQNPEIRPRLEKIDACPEDLYDENGILLPAEKVRAIVEEWDKKLKKVEDDE